MLTGGQTSQPPAGAPPSAGPVPFAVAVRPRSRPRAPLRFLPSLPFFSFLFFPSFIPVRTCQRREARQQGDGKLLTGRRHVTVLFSSLRLRTLKGKTRRLLRLAAPPGGNESACPQPWTLSCPSNQTRRAGANDVSGSHGQRPPRSCLLTGDSRPRRRTGSRADVPQVVATLSHAALLQPVKTQVNPLPARYLYRNFKLDKYQPDFPMNAAFLCLRDHITSR